MHGYVTQRRGRFYAVIYEGLDPVTGREIRRWHPAGTDRADAERLATKLAKVEQGRADATCSLTVGAFLVRDWLPTKKLRLASTTYAGYKRNVDRHVLPALGRIRLRRLTHPQIEALYDRLLTPSAERPALAHKTVYEIHLVIRGALDHALRRGLVTKNVAVVARSPMIKATRRPEARSWTEQQLQQFLRAANGHRFFPLLWLTAMTGMRRNEVLGLQWGDIDFKRQRLSLYRGLVAVGYEVQQTRGKTRNARRPIDLDPTTLSILEAWRSLQRAEAAATGVELDGWVFTDGDGHPVHPHAITPAFERIARRAGVPVIRLHELRHTHGTLLIKAGVPVKVVSERLGHGNITLTIETYQHVMPGMQADAARVYEALAKPAAASPVEHRRNARRNTA
jgi:integrase